MSYTVKDPDTGEEKVTYTQEEIDEQIKTVKEEGATEKAQEVEDLQKKLEEKETELKGLKDKDYNFEKMRGGEKKLKDEIDSLKQQISDGIDGLKKERIDEKLAEKIKKLTGEDEEIAKQVKHHFEVTLKGVETKTPEEFEKKAKDAFLLATGGEEKPKVGPGALHSGAAGGGFKQGGAGGGKSTLKPEVIAMGKKHFGITDEDIKKYDTQDFSDTA